MKEYDFIIIGSGFGGSVSALRLTEKGYRVLLLEKGRRWANEDFARTNWNLSRWFWQPLLGWRGIFKMTFLPDLTAVSGVGFGGGSLVYAATLPAPADDFFARESWAHLADWKNELAVHYATARRMLGATPTPCVTYPDKILRQIAVEMGREEHLHPTNVGIYFGPPGQSVPDPFFSGAGPERTGCTFCGGCMVGCRHGAKNSLDKNYLYLAEKNGLQVVTDIEVTKVNPMSGGGYRVAGNEGATLFGRREREFKARQVIFAGGVLGTVPLLLKLKGEAAGLPSLSDNLGAFVRTNSESIISVISERRDQDLSQGIAIGSILNTDEHSHLEPVRWPAGSGFFRILLIPHVGGEKFPTRLAGLGRLLLRHPWRVLKAFMVPDFAKNTMSLLYMRTLEGTLQLKLGRGPSTFFRRGLTTGRGAGEPPAANIPEADELAERVAEKLDGLPTSMVTETLLGVPSTAHILGGCCMGDSSQTGVIDHRHRVFGYEGLYIIDGSAISANPGVNPSLTITALAERAMTFIPPKNNALNGQ